MEKALLKRKTTTAKLRFIITIDAFGFSFSNFVVSLAYLNNHNLAMRIVFVA